MEDILADEVIVEVVEVAGELEAAYGCIEGATGVRGENPPEEVEVSKNIALPMASISAELSTKSILPTSAESRPSSEYWLICLEECDDSSEVGEVDAGDEGVVEAVDTETDDGA